jgi:hypothetical protein
MSKLVWDKVGERYYEAGVDHGVLYIPDDQGSYTVGYAWNGLTGVTESPTGAESNPQYADNIKYLNLISAEEFGGTIEAFTYPPEFGQCDGTASPVAGLAIGQQARKQFGLSYRTKVGNDTVGQDLGYKLHVVYGALAAPSEKAYTTINDSPEALAFSWEFTTTPVDVPDYKPSATLSIDSTKVDATALAALEDILYGTAGQDPRLPLPEEIVSLFEGTVTVVSPAVPTFVAATDTLTIPATTGVVYKVDGKPIAAGNSVITKYTLVTASAAPGYTLDPTKDTDWGFDPA